MIIFLYRNFILFALLSTLHPLKGIISATFAKCGIPASLFSIIQSSCIRLFILYATPALEEKLPGYSVLTAKTTGHYLWNYLNHCIIYSVIKVRLQFSVTTDQISQKSYSFIFFSALLAQFYIFHCGITDENKLSSAEHS